METMYIDLRDTKGQQQIITQKIAAAASIIREGGLVGIPTETVYGLGANGLDENAVRKIFEAKGRPQDNPLILHITGAQWLPRYCDDVPPLAYMLARKFWPGPLTMILKAKPIVPKATTAGLSTVAMRCPNHQVTLSIIREAGVPIAAPSANISGRPSCTSAQDVLEDMGGKIEAVVDGGPCSVGVESTILDLTCDPPRMLRAGGLPLEEIESLIGPVEMDRAITEGLGDGEVAKAPGMKYRHYAPKAPVTVVSGAPKRSAAAIAELAQPGDGVICFDEFAAWFPQQTVQTLGSSEDKTSHAQRVFDALRAFDGSGVPVIYAQCPDSRGLGLAVGNRLKKAAGFHVIEADEVRVVLGITGGSGAGKTSALEAVRDLGGTVVDCDALYYRMLEEDEGLRRAIAEKFPGVFGTDGKLDRKKLGQIVFSDPEYLEMLNDIVYHYVVPEAERLVQGTGLFAIDAVNLTEAGLGAICDRTVAVTAPAEQRVRRIMARDGISEHYARLRISAQNSDDYYRQRCDVELANKSESAEEFRQEAYEFFRRLIREIKEDKLREKQ